MAGVLIRAQTPWSVVMARVPHAQAETAVRYCSVEVSRHLDAGSVQDSLQRCMHWAHQNAANPAQLPSPELCFCGVTQTEMRGFDGAWLAVARGPAGAVLRLL